MSDTTYQSGTLITSSWLNEVNDHVYNTQAGEAHEASEIAITRSGGTERTVKSKLEDIISLRDFGAVGDGVTDDSAAVTAFNAAAISTSALCIIPKGEYLVGGTVYSITGDCLYTNDNFSAGVSTVGEAENKSILLVGNTPNEGGARIPANDRTLLGITLNATGDQHGNCARFNITNTSTQVDGNTGLYVRATSSTNSIWLAGLHSETRHLEGTTIGTNIECQSFTSGSAFIGLNVQNTTDSTMTHPATGAAAVQSDTGIGVRVAGRSFDLGGWKYGIRVIENAISSTGISVQLDANAIYGLHIPSGTVNSGADIFLEGSSQNGLVCAGTYTSGNAIRVKTGQAISLETTGVHKIVSGTGSPQGVVTASVGSLYCRLDGGANTTLYVKESGTGNTGWVAK